MDKGVFCLSNKGFVVVFFFWYLVKLFGFSFDVWFVLKILCSVF